MWFNFVAIKFQLEFCQTRWEQRSSWRVMLLCFPNTPLQPREAKQTPFATKWNRNNRPSNQKDNVLTIEQIKAYCLMAEHLPHAKMYPDNFVVIVIIVAVFVTLCHTLHSGWVYGDLRSLGMAWCEVKNHWKSGQVRSVKFMSVFCGRGHLGYLCPGRGGGPHVVVGCVPPLNDRT